MKTNLLRLSAIFCVALCAGSVVAAEKRLHFIEPKEIDVRGILSGPSLLGSAETLHEMEIVLDRQAARTPADEARITREGQWAPALFGDVLGAWFAKSIAENSLPVTAQWLDVVGRDTMAICDAAKKLWSRPRPPLQDARVHPSVGLPANTSYPSGHGAYGFVLGAVLAELAPDLREELIRRGEVIGDGRVTGGVHFPSDVEAGRSLGRAILARLQTNPQFRATLEAARAEFARVRSLKESAAVQN